ncbi:MAG TPA: Imm1 family immunity protein [Pseudonocardiaceae bacterium]|nr:Imm1 family immunity protein [Pseudonocardiaceae bacterium]
MTAAGFDSLADQVEIDISALGRPEDIDRLLTDANSARLSASGRVWFLFGRAGDDAPCLVVGVRGAVGALEWIADQRFVPAHGVNTDWVSYYTVDMHDNEMPPRSELPLAEVIAAATEFARTSRRPDTIEWQPVVD